MNKSHSSLHGKLYELTPLRNISDGETHTNNPTTRAQILVYMFDLQNVTVIHTCADLRGCCHSPVEFGSLHQSVRVSITDERPAAQTGEAFWVILLFSGDLEHTDTEIRDASVLRLVQNTFTHIHSVLARHISDPTVMETERR